MAGITPVSLRYGRATCGERSGSLDLELEGVQLLGSLPELMVTVPSAIGEAVVLTVGLPVYPAVYA